MRILYLCHRFPYPPNRGGKIRPFNMIQHLSKEHEVHVVSLGHSDEDVVDAEGISPYCASWAIEYPAKSLRWARMLARLPTSLPSAPAYFYSRALQRRVDTMLAASRFDLIFVHCAFVAEYVSSVKGVSKILDFGDMDSQKWLSYGEIKQFPLSAAYTLEGRKMERFERRMANSFDCCTTTTKLELESLDSLGASSSSAWFPNGVDGERFVPVAGEPTYDKDTIAFVGRMDYLPNQKAAHEFAHEILPLIQKQRPASKFLIIGANPSREVLSLGKLTNVTVTGTVPDVRDFVRSAALTVAPIHIARGTQNKVLESMALGVPVVASSQAAKGVDATPGTHLLVADFPEKFAEQVLLVMNNPEKRAALAAYARDRVMSNHSWSSSMARLDDIIARTTNGL